MALATLDLRDAERATVRHHLVDNLQGLLVATQRADCHPGNVDGLGGPRTRQAVLAFQRVAGLSEDAIVGPVTWRRLIEW